MAKHFRQTRRRVVRTGNSSAHRPQAEPLEDRRLLSNIFTVTNTLDDGSTGSLRWAIGEVDADTSDSAPSPDRIDFNIPQSDPRYAGGAWTISPTSDLPPVTNPVVIDGYTQSGASPNTNGPGLGDNATLTVALNGLDMLHHQSALLHIQSSNVVVRGLIVEGFFGQGGVGILITNSNDDVLAGDFIGTNGSSSSLPSNGNPGTGTGTAGITIYMGNANTIGGTTPEARNVISNNGTDVGNNLGTGAGVSVGGDDNLIAGNFFGTDSTGTVSLPNYAADITLEFGTANTVGGTTPDARNIIAGSNDYSAVSRTYGVLIEGDSDSVVAGNFIGTDVTGTVALPGTAKSRPSNTVGVAIVGFTAVDSNGNPVAGSPVPGASIIVGNVIAGNGEQGISVEAINTPFDSVIEGNLIGTDATGNKALPNAIGIEVESSNTTVGGTTAGTRNVISGNLGAGITITPSSLPDALPVSDVLIEGNSVGTDADGQNAVPNQTGIELEDVQNCTVGGTALGARNVIGGNAGDGVMIMANPNQPATDDNWIAGNWIGTDATGQNPLGNEANGVFLSGQVFSNTIGGTVAGAGNVIAYNRVDGIAIVDSSQSGGPIEENSIYDNAYLGIDVGDTLVPRVNGDSGGYYPYLTGESRSSSKTSAGGPRTTITGILDGLSDGTARIEFFSDPTPGHSTFGQGKTYLGSLDVTSTNEDKQASFTFTYNGDLAGRFITATATYSGNSTSEFSPDFPLPSKSPIIAQSATPNPAFAGQAVTVTVFLPDQPLYVGNAVVAPSVTPTGNVALFVDGQDAWNSVDLHPVVNAQGVAGMTAVVTLSNLDPGTHVITAHYYGGSLPPADSAPLTVVNSVPSVVGLSVSPDPASVGQPVTFTATVMGFATVPGQNLPTASGFVDFREGTVTLAQVPVDATGRAVLTTSTLGAGNHEVVAYYEGDAIFDPNTSNSVTTFVSPSAGPTVLSVQRSGIGVQPTAIVLTFSQPLNTASAESTNNYVIRGPGQRRIRVNFGRYNAAADTVTLTPARHLNVRVDYTVTVNGTSPHGVTDVYGNLLDGAGRNGTNYVTTLPRLRRERR